MMHRIRNILLIGVTLVCIGVPLRSALSAFTVAPATGFKLDDALETIERCKDVNISATISKINAGYIKQFIADTLRDFAQSLISFGTQLLACKAANATGAGFGSPGSTPCSYSVGGAIESVLKRSALDNLRHDALAACILDQTGNDIRAMIQQNGPDGGMAVVEDYYSMYSAESARGRNRFYAELVNTDICPFFKDQVYAYFSVPQSYIDDPPSLTGIVSVDGNEAFHQIARCTLPEDFTPEKFDAHPDFSLFPVIKEPQNNFTGFIQLAERELVTQQSMMVQAAQDDATAGGGFRSFVACINQDPNGKCLAWRITQPSGGVRDANAAHIQATINSAQANQAYNNVRMRLASEILDIGAQALDTQISQIAQDLINIGDGTAVATPFSVASPATDPLCPTIPANCACVAGSSGLDGVRSMMTKAADEAKTANPDLVDASGNVLSGKEQAFLYAVCTSTTGQSLQCQTKNGSNDQVLIPLTGGTVSYTVLLGNIILSPGDAVAVCPAGTE